MLCVLFKSCLILAVPASDFRRYQLVACVGLRDFRVESTENGKGARPRAVPITFAEFANQGYSAILRFTRGRLSLSLNSDSSK